MDFQTKHRRNGADYQTGMVERRQIDQPYAVLLGGDHPLGNGKRDGSLADTSRPNNRHEALT
jgi:hypothetical protein